MRAMCPHCQGKGCDAKNCVDGYLQVKFAEGDWFTRLCINLEDCGFANGGRVSNGFPEVSSGPCVNCDGPTEWVPFDEIPENAGEGYKKNYEKFALKSLEESNETLRNRNKELRDLIVSWIKNDRKIPSLTLEQCRMLDICRICYEPSSAVFLFDEWAHKHCLGQQLNR